MKASNAKDTEAALRREASAIAEILSEAAKRMEKLEKRARDASRRDPLPEGDPRIFTYSASVVGASDCGCLESVRNASDVYRATARETDADLCRMKRKDDARVSA